MSSEPRTIGIFGLALLEVLNRPFVGINRYCQEIGGLVTRDFRMFESSDRYPDPPPWKGRCDGVVVGIGRAGSFTNSQVADWVFRGGVPAVTIVGDWSESRIAAFHTEQYAAGQMAAKHLVECGCRSFLYVGFVDSVGSAERSLAFRETLKRDNRRVAEYVCSTRILGFVDGEVVLRGEKGLYDALKKMPKPLGVWALNDNHAAVVCLACKHLGLGIPREVKVLGTDDIALARTNMPSLSSIRTAGEQIGYLAMKALHRLLDGKRAVGCKVPPEQLVVRESTVTGRDGLATLEAAQAYISRHACTGVTVDQCAHMLGISKRSFVSKFTTLFGHSPMQEILRVRLERAQELLQQPSIPVARIAAMVGFSDTAAFSKFFTKKSGKSPRAYRDNARRKVKRSKKA